MHYDGVNDRYLGIASDIANGGHTPPVQGCNVTLKQHGKTFAWYMTGTNIVLPRDSQLPRFEEFVIDKAAVHNALKK